MAYPHPIHLQVNPDTKLLTCKVWYDSKNFKEFTAPTFEEVQSWILKEFPDTGESILRTLNTIIHLSTGG